MDTWNGFRVIESHHLTEPGEPVQVRRSWKERLLTRPWRPRQATKIVVPQVPMRGAVRIGRHTVMMHPATVNELRKLTERHSTGRACGGGPDPDSVNRNAQTERATGGKNP